MVEPLKSRHLRKPEGRVGPGSVRYSQISSCMTFNMKDRERVVAVADKGD